MENEEPVYPKKDIHTDDRHTYRKEEGGRWKEGNQAPYKLKGVEGSK